MEHLFNISISYHPVDNTLILKQLRKKLGDIGAQIALEQERGAPRNPVLETSLQDIENLRDAIVQGQEKMFRVAVYITILAKSETELNEIEAKVQSLLESKLIYIKSANFRQFEGYESSLPLGLDRLGFSVLLNSHFACFSISISSSGTLLSIQMVLLLKRFQLPSNSIRKV